MSDTALHAVANLAAITLERGRSQAVALKAEAARQNQELKSTLLDALAHEFKTPLTLIRAVTSSVLAGANPLTDPMREQITIADEEAEHLRELLDNAI